MMRQYWCPVHGKHPLWGPDALGNLYCRHEDRRGRGCGACPCKPEVVDAVAETIAEIVAWLRISGQSFHSATELADSIERGEHLKGDRC